MFRNEGNLATPDTITKVRLARPIQTNMLRLFPQLWDGTPFVRININYCQEPDPTPPASNVPKSRVSYVKGTWSDTKFASEPLKTFDNSSEIKLNDEKLMKPKLYSLNGKGTYTNRSQSKGMHGKKRVNFAKMFSRNQPINSKPVMKAKYFHSNPFQNNKMKSRNFKSHEQNVVPKSKENFEAMFGEPNMTNHGYPNSDMGDRNDRPKENTSYANAFHGDDVPSQSSLTVTPTRNSFDFERLAMSLNNASLRQYNVKGKIFKIVVSIYGMIFFATDVSSCPSYPCLVISF